MSARKNKETIRRVMNMVNSGDLSGLNELCADNVVYRSSAGEEFHGVDGLKDLVSEYRNAFSNFEISLEDIVAEENMAFFIYRQMGTHTGELMGIKPSNQKMDFPIAAMVKFKNGKVVEQYDTYDTLELLKQLDAVSNQVRPGGSDWPTGGMKLRPQG